MLCTTGGTFPCGQCLSCRINKRRTWAARLMMEAQSHKHSIFSTLTYEVEPEGRTLVKSHLTETLHRLRDRARSLDRTVRYFGVGEYGDIGERPHYHACIFGLAPEHHELITASWQSINNVENGPRAGFVRHDVLSPDLANYIAGYTTKKLTSDTDIRLMGRAPEFAVMSRRPGIGMAFVPAFCEALNTSQGALYLARNKDVPTSFHCAGKTLPISSYIRQKLRIYFFGDHKQPRERADLLGAREHVKFLNELPPLPVDATSFQALAQWTATHETLKQETQKTLRVRKAQVATKHKIFKQKRTL